MSGGSLRSPRPPGPIAPPPGAAGGLRRVAVGLGGRSYEILVGPGALSELASVIPPSARRAAVITQAGIPVTLHTGLPTETIEIARGEASKSLATVGACCSRLARAGIARGDVVVGVGGGLVTDVAGLVASLWHRGTAVVQVATTLLAQVDAAIGGKTGVNLPEGKNLVGAFWQPAAVICDTDTLSSLPEEQWRSGRGELAKYELLGLDGLRGAPLVDQVARCAAFKAAVVSGDERDRAGRVVLNYGHTLAHALEAAGWAADAPGAAGARPAVLSHGEAVGIGLVFAARLSRALGRIDDARVDTHIAVVESYGLRTTLPDGVEAGELVELMGRDKKARGDLTFALDGPAGVEPVHGVPTAPVTEMIEAMRAEGP